MVRGALVQLKHRPNPLLTSQITPIQVPQLYKHLMRMRPRCAVYQVPLRSLTTQVPTLTRVPSRMSQVRALTDAFTTGGIAHSRYCCCELRANTTIPPARQGNERGMSDPFPKSREWVGCQIRFKTACRHLGTLRRSLCSVRSSDGTAPAQLPGTGASVLTKMPRLPHYPKPTLPSSEGLAIDSYEIYPPVSRHPCARMQPPRPLSRNGSDQVSDRASAVTLVHSSLAALAPS